MSEIQLQVFNQAMSIVGVRSAGERTDLIVFKHAALQIKAG